MTRHSNLSEVHSVFHLVADDSLLGDINSRHTVILGLRNILKACLKYDIITITIPLLLTLEMTEVGKASTWKMRHSNPYLVWWVSQSTPTMSASSAAFEITVPSLPCTKTTKERVIIWWDMTVIHQSRRRNILPLHTAMKTFWNWSLPDCDQGFQEILAVI